MMTLINFTALLLFGSFLPTTYGLDIVRLDKGHNVVTVTNCSDPEIYLILEDAIVVSNTPFLSFY